MAFYVYYHVIKRKVFLTNTNPFISQKYCDPETAVLWECRCVCHTENANKVMTAYALMVLTKVYLINI